MTTLPSLQSIIADLTGYRQVCMEAQRFEEAATYSNAIRYLEQLKPFLDTTCGIGGYIDSVKSAQLDAEDQAKYLADALEAEHKANDWLMATVIGLDKEFLPTKSPVWPAIVAGHAALERYRNRQL